MSHDLHPTSAIVDVLRCYTCATAISRGLDETGPQWQLRVEHFTALHSGDQPVGVSGPRLAYGQMPMSLAYISCQVCGQMLWQEVHQSLPAFRSAAQAFAKEHQHAKS